MQTPRFLRVVKMIPPIELTDELRELVLEWLASSSLYELPSIAKEKRVDSWIPLAPDVDCARNWRQWDYAVSIIADAINFWSVTYEGAA